MADADSTLDAYELARLRALLEGPGRKPASLAAVLAAVAFVAVCVLGLAITLLVAHPPG